MFEEIEIVGFVFEVQIGFYNESHHYVQEADVVHEKDHDKEELPSEGFFVLNKSRNVYTPRL